MRYAEWQKLDKNEKIKQASLSVIVGSVINVGDNTVEFINALKEIPEISTLDLLIEGGASRQRAAFAAFTKYLANDQHLSNLTIGSTFLKGDFHSDENQYFEVEIFKAIATNTVLEALTIKCYNITPQDIENLISAIRKNPQLKLKKITLNAAYFNKVNPSWDIEQRAINNYLAIRPLEEKLITTINKFEACASALSKELVDNLTTIFEELKKYDKYKTMAENPNFPAVKTITAVIALAEAKKYLVDDYNKLAKASQCYEIFNELPDSIESDELQLIDKLIQASSLLGSESETKITSKPFIDKLTQATPSFGGKSDITKRLGQFKTKLTSNTEDHSPGFLLGTEYEEISDILQTLKSSCHAFAIRTYQELGAKYPSASQELGNIYLTEIDPKKRVLAALYFFQAGTNADQELLRACQQLMLATFADKLNIDTSKNEHLNYFLKLQFNLQTLLKNSTTEEFGKACNSVLDFIAIETTENKDAVPKQEVAEQLQNLIDAFPKNEKLKKSCEVITEHVKGQQPKPDDMTVDRDALYTMTQNYLEKYSPKFVKSLSDEGIESLSDEEKEKQPLYYAIALYIRLLLELSDPIIFEKSTELFKRLLAVKHLWHKITKLPKALPFNQEVKPIIQVLPFYQEVKQIFEPVFSKYASHYNSKNNQEFIISLQTDSADLISKHFTKMLWLWRQAEVSNELKMQVIYFGLAIEEFKSIIHPALSKVETLIINFIQEFAQKLEKAATQNILKDMPPDLHWMERHSNFKASSFTKKTFSYIKEESSDKTKEILDFDRLQIQLKKLTTQGATATLTEYYKQKRAAITSLSKTPSNDLDQKENKQEENANHIKLG